ncbi:hypothetical protein D3C71_637250 [compost metagenome]
MKKPTFLIIICLFSSIVFGQNGLNSGDYFLLLVSKNKISLNTYENKEIKQKRTFEINEKTIFSTDQKTRVALLDTAQNTITLFQISSRKKIRLSIPFEIKPKCILMNGENLFIGGEMGKEMLIQYHIPSKKWFSLEIPTKVLSLRKGIDDLLIKDSLLMAIDNLVMPKYVLFYKLNSLGKQDFSHFLELKSNGAYEHILQGRISSDYVGISSITFSGYSGAKEHITIYDKNDLTKNFTLSFLHPGEWRIDNYTLNDFLLMGNKLIVSNKKEGLGIFEIDSSYLNPVYEYDECDEKHNYDRSENNRFNGDSELKYWKYEGKILRLTVLRNTTGFILTLEHQNGEISQEIVESTF